MSANPRILIVEDQRSERTALARLLKLEGFDTLVMPDAERALEHLREPFDLVLSDLRMSGLDGLGLLRKFRQVRTDVPFVLMTAYGDVQTAVKAMKIGAADYLTKPVHPDELLQTVRRLLAEHRSDDAPPAPKASGFDSLIGSSAAIQSVIDRASRAAKSDSLVLLLGESGVGKELVAQAVHQQSPRAKGPFVVVNMAAIPTDLVESELFGHAKGAFTGAVQDRVGKFEAAHEGTIFIDEIGDFASSSQAKLLRVLETFQVSPVGSNEEREVNVRVIAATSRDLVKLVAAGEFREDLFYRLQVVTVMIPPLRDRRDDIPTLVEAFLRESSERNRRVPPRVTPELTEFLEQHSWPGNVRQLRNAIESMVVLCVGDELGMPDVPPLLLQELETAAVSQEVLSLDRMEKDAVLEALNRCEGHRHKAAEMLGISVRTLQRRLKTWGLASADHPEPVES